MNQFHPQSAGLGPHQKLGGMYGGMWNFIPPTCSTNPTAPCPERRLTVKKLGKKQPERVASLSDATGVGGSPYGGPAVGTGGERASPKYGECCCHHEESSRRHSNFM